MAVKTIAFMLPWVDPLSANSNLYNAGLIARIETSIADRAITAGKALEINANIFDQQLNTTDSPTFAGLTVDTNTLFVDSTNNRVGVGTASPSANLHVVASTNDNTAGLRVQRNGQAGQHITVGTYTKGLIEFNGASKDFEISNNATTSGDIVLSAGGSTIATFERGGNVGIGTTSPSYALDVNGDVALSGRVFLSNGSESAPSLTVGSDTDTGFYKASNSQWRFTIGGTNTFLFSADYLRGPDGLLGTPGYAFQSDGNTGMWRISNGVLGFSANGIDALRVTSVGIRVFSGAAANPGYSFVDDTDSGMFLPANSQLAWALNNSEYMRLTTTGLGIGTTSPNATLHVNGTVRLQNLPTSSGGLSSGDLWNDSGTLKIA